MRRLLICVAFVVAEEGFHDEVESGRDDLCSRLCKVGMVGSARPAMYLPRPAPGRRLVWSDRVRSGTPRYSSA